MGIGDLVRQSQERVLFLLQADRTAAELVQILRDTHRILTKLEQTVDRLDAQAQELADKFEGADLSPKRLDRLEEAVLNIERATLTLEGSFTAGISALPQRLQQRLTRQRPTRQPD